jgi:predicted nucleic acid-binding protein
LIVVDASLFVAALVSEREYLLLGSLASTRGPLHALELTDLEVVSALRRMTRARELTADRARGAIEDYAGFPVTRHRHMSLTRRVFELRDNSTAYDGAYAALAELLGCRVATVDDRFQRALSAVLPHLLEPLPSIASQPPTSL